MSTKDHLKRYRKLVHICWRSRYKILGKKSCAERVLWSDTNLEEFLLFVTIVAKDTFESKVSRFLLVSEVEKPVMPNVFYIFAKVFKRTYVAIVSIWSQKL